jgi:hypothetical protein
MTKWQEEVVREATNAAANRHSRRLPGAKLAQNPVRPVSPASSNTRRRDPLQSTSRALSHFLDHVEPGVAALVALPADDCSLLGEANRGLTTKNETSVTASKPPSCSRHLGVLQAPLRAADVAGASAECIAPCADDSHAERGSESNFRALSVSSSSPSSVEHPGLGSGWPEMDALELELSSSSSEDFGRASSVKAGNAEPRNGDKDGNDLTMRVVTGDMNDFNGSCVDTKHPKRSSTTSIHFQSPKLSPPQIASRPRITSVWEADTQHLEAKVAQILARVYGNERK